MGRWPLLTKIVVSVLYLVSLCLFWPLDPGARVALIVFATMYYLPWLFIGNLDIKGHRLYFRRFRDEHAFPIDKVKNCTNLYWFPWELVIIVIRNHHRTQVLIAFDERQSGYAIPFWTFQGKVATELRRTRQLATSSSTLQEDE
jgi:hypothetical protein